VLDRERPYDGQPWTDGGERGKNEVTKITMRDLRDCIIRACYESSALSPKDYPKSIYELDFNQIDILAVVQSLLCWVEKYMEISPSGLK